MNALTTKTEKTEMNWTKILADAGIPDVPGRDKVLRSLKLPYLFEVILRDQKTDKLKDQFIEAFTLSEVTEQLAKTHKKHTIVKIKRHTPEVD